MGRAPSAPPACALTPRQREVLELLAAGLRVPAIAERLHISDRTVQNHEAALRERLEVHSRTEVVVAAWRRGWVR